MIRYLLPLLALVLFADDASACSRRPGRTVARVALAPAIAVVRVVEMPVQRVMARTTTRTRAVGYQTVAPVAMPAPAVVKSPCPNGGCPLPPKK